MPDPGHHPIHTFLKSDVPLAVCADDPGIFDVTLADEIDWVRTHCGLGYIIARDGELPEVLERKIWNAPIGGLLITSGATLLIANLIDLSSISTMGSAGFLLIFAAVNGANAVLADETRSNRWLSLLGAVLCLGALATLLWETEDRSPHRLWIPFIMTGLAFLIEATYRLFKRRKLSIWKQSAESC